MTLVTLMTGDAATNGFDADPKFLRFNSLFVEDISHKAKGCMGAAIFMGRTVYK